MKQFTVVCAWIVGFALVAELLSCAAMGLSVTSQTPCYKSPPGPDTLTHCYSYTLTKSPPGPDTLTIGVFLEQPMAIHTSGSAEVLSDHSFRAVTSLDSCACGPDTTIIAVAGADSMIVTKAGSSLKTYFSATAPLAPHTISVGAFYYVIFRRVN